MNNTTKQNSQSSDTPETDAAVLASHGQSLFVLRETCERLERERNEAREAFAVVTDQLVQAQSALRRAERERDEAREQIKGWENKWRCAVEFAALAQNKLQKAAK